MLIAGFAKNKCIIIVVGIKLVCDTKQNKLCCLVYKITGWKCLLDISKDAKLLLQYSLTSY